MAAPRTREAAALIEAELGPIDIWVNNAMVTVFSPVKALEAEAVAEAHHLTISAHTAPSLHLAPALALPGLDHLEWFHDHVRIERMLFDGAPMPSAV